MSEHPAGAEVSNGESVNGLPVAEESAGASPAAPERAIAASPESILGDVEAMLLSAGKTVPYVRMAVALGMITQEAADERSASGSKESTDTSEAPAAEVTVPRPRKRKSRSAPVDAEGIIARAVELLNEQYQQTGRAFRIERIAGGYRFITLARHAKVLSAFHQDRDSVKLSRQAIETLAIIAYRQPITRAELEAIRGVACGEVLRSLMERRLIAIVGRSEELGRPMLYGTTKHFLDAFGLASLKDLPSAQDLKSAL